MAPPIVSPASVVCSASAPASAMSTPTVLISRLREAWRYPRSAPRAGTSTTSTSSSDEKSTAGRKRDDAVETRAARGRLHRADGEPLGIDAVDARRDDDVAGRDVGQVRDELHARAAGRLRRRRPCPPARVRSLTAPTAALRSMMSCTRAACAATGPTTRPTTPLGAITAMSACTPSALPRLTVTVSSPGLGLPAMTSAASVGRVVLSRRLSAPAAARLARPAPAAPAGGLRGRRPAGAASRSRRGRRATRRSLLQVPATPRKSPAAPP